MYPSLAPSSCTSSIASGKLVNKKENERQARVQGPGENMDNIISQLSQFKAQIDELMSRIDILGKAQRAEQLEKKPADPTFGMIPKRHKRPCSSYPS